MPLVPNLSALQSSLGRFLRPSTVVLTWVSGLDYARVRRLAGSTFKPFVVLAGLRETPPVGLGETFDGAARPGLGRRRTAPPR